MNLIFSMPKEKSLLVIGVWLIILAYFVSIPTEIKNILFLLTGVVIIFISYGLSWERIRPRRNRGSEEHEHRMSQDSHVPHTSHTLSDIHVTPSYDEPIKVKKSRTRTRQKFREDVIPQEEIVSEKIEIAIEEPKREVSPASEDDDGDVIVISSDTDKE